MMGSDVVQLIVVNRANLSRPERRDNRYQHLANCRCDREAVSPSSRILCLSSLDTCFQRPALHLRGRGGFVLVR